MATALTADVIRFSELDKSRVIHSHCYIVEMSLQQVWDFQG